MTTIASLAARDFIAVGCDSLATHSRPLLNPSALQKAFFDENGLKKNPDGSLVLSDMSQLWDLCEHYPVNQLPSVTKLFDLKPKKAGLLFAGATRIGDVSIRHLVERLKHDDDFQNADTVLKIAECIKKVWVAAYENQIPEAHLRPEMEILLSGYSDESLAPQVFRIKFAYEWDRGEFDCPITNELSPGEYNIFFGGQYDVIQRVVNGVDVNSWSSLKACCWEVLDEYRSEVQNALSLAGISYQIPPIDFSQQRYDLFRSNFGNVTRIFSDIGSLSEQAGIDFVEFLIETMIKAQEFSSSIGTVGGEIHVAVIDASAGLRWVSREEYKLKDHRTPKFDVAKT